MTGIPFAVRRPFLALSTLTETLAGLGWRRRAARHAVRLSDMEFVAIDLETTGLDPRRDRIVSIAAIPFGKGGPQPAAGFTRVVNPGQPIPATAQAIHRIGDADVRDAPPVAAALPELLTRCRDRVIVAHAADLDLAIINRAARAAGLDDLAEPVLDVRLLANALLPSWWDLSLEGLGRLVGVETIGRHTAEGDALTAGAIFVRMVPLLAQRGILTLGGALRLQRQAPSLPGGPGATGGGLAGP